MRFTRSLTPFTVAFLAMLSCVSTFDAYAIHAVVSADNRPLTLKEVDYLRDIVRGLTEGRNLRDVRDLPSSWPSPADGEVRDEYITARQPSLEIALVVAPERRTAEIWFTDWDATGQPSSRTRLLQDQLRRELTIALPQLSVKFEDQNLGLLRP